MVRSSAGRGRRLVGALDTSAIKIIAMHAPHSRQDAVGYRFARAVMVGNGVDTRAAQHHGMR